MRLNNVIIKFLFIGIFLHSCIEPFTPETSDYEEMMLIEGLVTDNPMVPARVTISKTVQLNKEPQGNSPAGSNAVVSIVCDDGNVYPFTETFTGVYEDINNTLELDSGKLYKLIVQTIGETFESEFEVYKPSPPIDSITYAPEFVKTTELNLGAHGLQFYAHSTSLDEKPLYLRWILDATYQYSVPFSSNYIWNGESLEEFENDTLKVCWKQESIPGIYIDDSYGLMQNRVANAHLNFVSQFGDQLTVKYSLHAFQLSISESSYKFWYNLNKLINETGGLYETQPFRLKGNIHCTSDPDINVTGVFEVAGVSELRVFALRPSEFLIYSSYCQLDTIGIETLPWEEVRPGSYVTEPDDGLFMTAPDHCFNCLMRGGTLYKPPFWK